MCGALQLFVDRGGDALKAAALQPGPPLCSHEDQRTPGELRGGGGGQGGGRRGGGTGGRAQVELAPDGCHGEGDSHGFVGGAVGTNVHGLSHLGTV